ncbi:MAG: hypothetical protein ACOVP7_11875 [Lacibacter sp.]
MKNVIVLLLTLLFAGCKKITGNKTYTIQGQILESSSNPVPVAGYDLSFSQPSIFALLGGDPGFDKTIKTTSDGRFVFKYSSSGNDRTIFIRGVDTLKYRKLYPEWFPVTALGNVNLNSIYLFKKIDRLVRKVQFNTALNSGEVLEVITTDSSGASYNNIFGPVNAGTLMTVDTIVNCKMSRLHLLTREYVLSAVLKKPFYQKHKHR